MDHPFTCIVSGPTKSGKTTFVINLLKNKDTIINKPIENIWWCFTENQPSHDDLKGMVKLIKGVPDVNALKSCTSPPDLIILDDLMQEMKGNYGLIQLFTRGCHHWNISVIHIVQNLFFDGLRTSRINSDYIVLFKNPADQLQSCILARQLFPTKPKYFQEAHTDATKAPHGYLFIDLTQNAEDLHRLRTDVLSPTPTVYIPNL